MSSSKKIHGPLGYILEMVHQLVNKNISRWADGTYHVHISPKLFENILEDNEYLMMPSLLKASAKPFKLLGLTWFIDNKYVNYIATEKDGVYLL